MTTRRTFERSGVAFSKARTWSSSQSRKVTPRWVWRAGLRLRMALSSAISATMLPGRSQSQARIWYFSLSRYSSRPGMGVASQSSKPL